MFEELPDGAEEQLPASPELLDMVAFALDQGLDSLREGGPLIPFIHFVDAVGEAQIERFMAQNFDDAIRKARTFVETRGDELQRVTLVYDGYLSDPQTRERHDAIFVQAFEAGAEESLLFAQTYRPVDDEEGFAVTDEPWYCGTQLAMF